MAELVEHLEGTLFSFSAEAVRRKRALSAIAEFLSERSWQASFDEGAGGPDGPAHSIAYARLVDCGWIVEHRDGLRTVVDFDSDARVLLQALLDIKSGKVRSFGGEVLQVKSLVETAIADPESASQNIASAGGHARRFMLNIRAITGALRKIEQDMKSRATVRDMMSSFFDGYVTDTLVTDYKKLRSRNNPYRFRHVLVETVQAAVVNGPLLDVLGAAYAREGRASDAAQAIQTIQGDLMLIAEVFSAVDDHLDMIERTNSRIERRLRNIARFLDRMGDDRTGAFVAAARALGQSRLSADHPLPVAAPILDEPSPVDAASLYRARAKPRITPKVVARRKERDPAMVRFEMEKRIYGERARITPEKVRAYLARQLVGRTRMPGSAMTIETLDDFFVFERLLFVHQQFGDRLPEIEVRPLRGALVDNEWIACPDFEVRLLEEAADGIAA